MERIERERKLEAGKEVIELREKLEFAGSRAKAEGRGARRCCTPHGIRKTGYFIG